MAETETGPTADNGDEGLGAEASQSTALVAQSANESLVAQSANESLPELPSDYYVTLQPLTLDLVATQLERIGIKFNREPDEIKALWDSFALFVQILSNYKLGVRITFLQNYPAASVTSLAGRCNWWNVSRIFLKASVETVAGPTQPGEEVGESRYGHAAQVYLDFELPLLSGIAPVQLQSLFREIIGNVRTFESQARLNDLIAQVQWE